MSAVNSVTNANVVVPVPPVKPGNASGSAAPVPVEQLVDTADISRAGARGYLQLSRIEHGVKSGHLSKSQAKSLVKEEDALQDRIAAQKTANGGDLSVREGLKANRDLNRISRQIYDAIRDPKAPGVAGPPTPAPGSIVNVAA